MILKADSLFDMSMVEILNLGDSEPYFALGTTSNGVQSAYTIGNYAHTIGGNGPC